MRALNTLLESPFTLFPTLIEWIERAARHAHHGRQVRIIIKVNALTGMKAIQALCRASQAGKRIDLPVRRMCRLRPGIPGVSDNSRVRSVIGRFLEHMRGYCFHNGGDATLDCASADLMARNLYQRVEVAFPVLDGQARTRILDELAIYLADNTQVWILNADGSYTRWQPGTDEPVGAQNALHERLADA